MKLRSKSFLLASLLLTLGGVPAAAGIAGKDLLTEKAVDVRPGKMGTVLVFMSAKCPCSNSHVGLLKRMAADFKGFSFVVVHSNSDEPVDVSKPYFKTAAFPFPVIQDSEGKIANEYKALKTPHAFVITADGKIVYKGGVTNSVVGETADKQFLRDALSDIEAGRSVKVADGRTLGCSISRGEKHVW